MSLYDVIRKPIITEASMQAMDQKKYTFEGTAEWKHSIKTKNKVIVKL